MVPLLVSALVGIGVKIATDLLSSGVKKALAPNAPPGQSTFSALLDRARGTATAGAPAAPTRLAAADQIPLRMADAPAAVPAASRAYGAATYHRMDVEAP